MSEPSAPPPGPAYQPYQQPHPQSGYRPPYGYAGPGPVSPQDERTWATLAHLSPFVGGFVGFPVLGPLVVYLMYKDRSAFVRANAASALNFQLLLLIVSVVGGVLALIGTLLTVGLALFVVVPVALAIAVGAIVLQVIAAVAANRGEVYRYPLTPVMVS